MSTDTPTIPSNQQIDTGGGTYIEGKVITSGGDFVGRDKIVRGDEIHYHHPPVPGQLNQARGKPDNFVERHEITAAIKKRLLANTEVASPVVIHGIGGIGKTTLAIALTNDKDVEKYFSEGIIWVKLGQQPDLLAILREKIYDLGGGEFQYHTIDSASTRFRGLLRNKSALLVIDDAWESEHVEPFRVGGAKCRLLVTTRQSKIAEVIDRPDSEPIVGMNEAEAIELMAKRAGEITDENKPIAYQLAGELGYLPLALDLAGGQVQNFGGWQEFLNLWREKKLEILRRGRHVTTKEDSVLISFELGLKRLPEADKQLYLQLGVFPQGAFFPINAVSKLWELEKSETTELLQDFAGQALLTRQVIDGMFNYKFHDLLHKYVVETLGDEGLFEAHVTLLDNYWLDTHDGLWHTLADDGYVYSRLSWHMEQAGNDDDLHMLLSEDTTENQNGWYQRREEMGQTAGYLADVNRAWRLSETAFAKHHASIEIGRQCRYALITASLNSLAKNIQPALLIALVKKGVWTLLQGLTYARQIPNSEQRAESLAGLAPLLVKANYPQEALAVASEIKTARYRVEALTALAPLLSNPQHQEEALEIAAKIKNHRDRAVALTKLSVNMSGAIKDRVLRQALTAAQQIENEQSQADVLIELVQQLPGEAPRALNATLKIDQEIARAGTLVKLIPLLPESLLEQVLAQVVGFKNQETQTTVLMKLAAYLNDSKRKEALKKAVDAALEVESEWERASLLADLAPLLQEENLLERALNAAQDMENEKCRIRAFAGLAPHLPQPLLWRALGSWLVEMGDTETSLSTIPDVENERWWVKALVAVGETEKALAVAQTIRNERRRAKMLVELAPNFDEPETVLKEALAAAQAIDSERSRANTLAELAFDLPDPEQVLEEALATARSIDNEWMQARTLVGLVPYFHKLTTGDVLGKQLVEEALAVSRQIEDDKARTDALTNLTTWLMESDYPKEALATVRAIEDVDDQKRVLKTLAFRLMEFGHPQEALATIGAAGWDSLGEIEGGWRQAAIQAGIAPRLSETPAKEPSAIRKAIEAISDTDDQTKMLMKLVFRLMDLEHPREALTAAQAIGAERHRRDTIMKLSELLPESLREEALTDILEGVRRIESERDRAKGMVELVPYLPDRRRERVIEEARIAAKTLEDDWARAEALAELGSVLAEMGFPFQGSRVAWTISQDDDLSALTRAKVLAELAPYLSESRKQKILEEVLATVNRIKIGEFSMQIVTQIAPDLSESLRQDALQVAREIKIEKERVEALGGLAPYLPEPLKTEALNEALTAAQQMSSSGTSQAETLSRLVVHLNRKSLLRQALSMALTINGDSNRARVLQALSPQLATLAQSDLADLWLEEIPDANLLHTLVTSRTRRSLLSDLRALEPVITALGNVEGMTETARATQDVGRWWP